MTRLRDLKSDSGRKGWGGGKGGGEGKAGLL